MLTLYNVVTNICQLLAIHDIRRSDRFMACFRFQISGSPPPRPAPSTVRQYYSQNYIDDMTAGNTSASMAWSGDILY
jgi:hypothetical protein